MQLKTVPERQGDDKFPPRAPRDANESKPNEMNAPKPDVGDVSSAPNPKPIVSATGQIRFILVSGRGEARGLILSSGEQIDLPKELRDAGLTISTDTQVTAEGESALSDFGKFIHPTRLTIGNQTFSFNR